METFTDEEKNRLFPYVTNVDKPVFVVHNLPEVVKGALFARYSRSPKSLRRLLLDEFLTDDGQIEASSVGLERGQKLYDKVFVEYGDDSVAQLGAVHLACEGASNILTKILERGRLAAYLEQSTRYIPYIDKPDGKWRYHVPDELKGHELEKYYIKVMDLIFETYSRWIPVLIDHFESIYPEDNSPRHVKRAVIRAQALDVARGLLPASTKSNVGIFANGQALESLLLRMRVAPEAEARYYAGLMLEELRKVIPSFMKRVDIPDRGVVWSEYIRSNRESMEEYRRILSPRNLGLSNPVELLNYDADGEDEVVIAALWSHTKLPEMTIRLNVQKMSRGEKAEVLKKYVGARTNRRHRPGRAFERTRYRFEVVADYGVFRDLQRHRMLSIDWKPLCVDYGYVVPDKVKELGGLIETEWNNIMELSASLYNSLIGAGLTSAAPYAVCMAYRILFYMDMNAREAMHILELRTSKQGHESYRVICQEMHRLIRDRAGHKNIANAMKFVDHSSGDFGRRESETKKDLTRQVASGRVRGS